MTSLSAKQGLMLPFILLHLSRSVAVEVKCLIQILTCVKFLHVSNERTPRHSRPPSPVHACSLIGDEDNVQIKRRVRSLSASMSSKDAENEMKERMKHTRDFKMKGYKANSRGHCIQAPFTTLEEMFKKLPESIGFNIEMSMFFHYKVSDSD